MDFELQKKLLRVLQEKNFTRVGGHEQIQVNAEIICATNVDLNEAVIKKEFRKDLYYRISQCEIYLPPLCERKEDIPLLVDHFIKKFSSEYKRQVLDASKQALAVLEKQKWDGNVRDLENVIRKLVIRTKKKIIEIDDLTPEIRKNIKISEDDEKISIIKALEGNDYNVTKTAEELGINRNQLNRKMVKYGINGPRKHKSK